MPRWNVGQTGTGKAPFNCIGKNTGHNDSELTAIQFLTTCWGKVYFAYFTYLYNHLNRQVQKQKIHLVKSANLTKYETKYFNTLHKMSSILPHFTTLWCCLRNCTTNTTYIKLTVCRLYQWDWLYQVVGMLNFPASAQTILTLKLQGDWPEFSSKFLLSTSTLHQGSVAPHLYIYLSWRTLLLL